MKNISWLYLCLELTVEVSTLGRRRVAPATSKNRSPGAGGIDMSVLLVFSISFAVFFGSALLWISASSVRRALETRGLLAAKSPRR